MRIFLAGATGVLGRRTVPPLLAAGHDVTALARTPEAERRLSGMGARPTRLDLFDADAVATAVAGHDAVVNLATSIPTGAATALPWAWSENTRIRTQGARNLVDAALRAGAGRVVQESVVFTYADGGDAWLDEDAALAPIALTRAALEAERQAQRLTDVGGVGVALRFSTFHAEDAAHTVDAVRLLRRGKAAVIGREDTWFPSIMADDAATAVVAALAAPAGVYNVGDDEPLTREAYTRASAEAFGVPMPRLQPALLGKVPGLEALARSRRVSARRFREAAGWSPVYPSMREGWREIARRLEEVSEVA